MYCVDLNVKSSSHSLPFSHQFSLILSPIGNQSYSVSGYIRVRNTASSGGTGGRVAMKTNTEATLLQVTFLVVHIFSIRIRETTIAVLYEHYNNSWKRSGYELFLGWIKSENNGNSSIIWCETLRTEENCEYSRHYTARSVNHWVIMNNNTPVFKQVSYSPIIRWDEGRGLSGLAFCQIF